MSECTDPTHKNLRDFIAGDDRLNGMLEEQRKLQILLGRDINNMTADELAQYIVEMAFACTDELHEAVNEIGWKSWASSRHVNHEAFFDEMTDAWLFFLNLMIATGMTGDDLFNRYVKKRNNAELRFYGKYDGVSTKCPGCKRAYDNDAVKCTPVTDMKDATDKPRPAWCAARACWLINGVWVALTDEDSVPVVSGYITVATPFTDNKCPGCGHTYGSGQFCVRPTLNGFGWCHPTKRGVNLGVA